MRRFRIALVVALLAAAWWSAPKTPLASTTSPAARAVRFLLGPFRGLVAGGLRLRAAFARSAGAPAESIRLQEWALEIDPSSTDAALLLAGELAFDLAAATPSQAHALADAAVAILERAKALGNRSPRIPDAQASLLAERIAPAASGPDERRRALERAVALAEDAVALGAPAARARASHSLGEIGLLAHRAGRFDEAKEAFARAAAHERALARIGAPQAARLARLYAAREELSAREAAAAPEAERARARDALRAIDPADPLLGTR
ncbi:MAG TPA: hypothetical protein VKE69_10600 [Planctomycetota bacterium]|nr:hypothetical protein [Planctomycetota bacterium]